MKLIFDLFGAGLAGEDRRPSDVMNELGIRWIHFEAQPIADQIVFSYCSNVPAELPPYIRRAGDEAARPAAGVYGDIIARLEALKEPDREVDYAIAEVHFKNTLKAGNYSRLPGDAGWISERPAVPGAERMGQAPGYTGSLDEASGLVMTLRPRVSWRVGNLSPWSDDRGFAMIGADATEHEAATPAIALLLALFRSLEPAVAQ